MQDVASKQKQWIVHNRCAVGAQNGEITINVAQNSQSSSILPMLDAHLVAAPNSQYINKHTAPLITLDSIFDQYYQAGDRCFLKIDTQGYEAEVLEGAKNSLSRMKYVQVELSVLPLYDSQELYEYFFAYMKKNGLDLWSIIPGFTDRQSGRLLQFDAIFFRPD